MRRRTAYSLALVRLILVPVIFLAVYYLFRMAWIVDRIVNVDAPAATLAQQASIAMLEARRAERNYLLLHDAVYLETNQQSVDKTQEILNQIRNLEPDDQDALQEAAQALVLYRQRFAKTVSAVEQPGQRTTDRIQAVVKAYEQDLDGLLKKARYGKREQVIEELRKQVDSFDTQISETVQQGNPDLRLVTGDLQTSSQDILRLTSDLESRNWNRVKQDHAEARHLLRQAEWALSIVSLVTLLISVWVSYELPRQVIKPLLNLKEAVDHAAAGNYEIDFDVEGKGEIVDLTNSLRSLFAVVRERQREC